MARDSTWQRISLENSTTSHPKQVVDLQNRYVGDVGDFGKYGLLRALCLPDDDMKQPLSLGVVWYLTSDETHNNDGRHIGYLEPTPKNHLAFRACDPELYDGLGEIVRGGDRNVSAIRRQRILPEGTVYYERVLDLKASTVRPRPASRIQDRQEWVDGAVQATQDCDVVFVDPDNGIGSTAQAYSRLGAKYVLLEELLRYVGRDQTLVIYHHLNRQAPAETQIKDRLVQVRQSLRASAGVIALRYRRGSARVLLVCPSLGQQRVLTDRITKLTTSAWNQHFQRYPI